MINFITKDRLKNTAYINKDAKLCSSFNGSSIDGFYVYMLIDPRDMSIFYIGKGSKYRLLHHQKKSTYDRNHIKLKRIEEIERSGGEVMYFIIDTFNDEQNAFELEYDIIGCLWEYGITNIAGGFVSEDRKTIAYCERSLANIKPRPAWLSQLSNRQRLVLKNVFGSPVKFYNKMVNEYKDGIKKPWKWRKAIKLNYRLG